MKLKTRIKCKHFLNGTKVTSSYIVEACVGRSWSPMGDNEGITKYESKELAQIAADELSNQEIIVN